MPEFREITSSDYSSFYPPISPIRSEVVKAYLNELYGKGVESMRNDFIILHTEGKPLLIRKDGIIAVRKSNEGKASITTIALGYREFVDETYEEVVRKLFK